MSVELKKEVEDWLDAHWDSAKQCESGADSYDEKSWMKKVVDAGYAVPTWPENGMVGGYPRKTPAPSAKPFKRAAQRAGVGIAITSARSRYTSSAAMN